jgi:hypothetical protein
MGKIVLRQENVDEGTLDNFIRALEEATGCKVKWSQVYELEVDDPKAAAILQTVFDNNGDKAPARPAKANFRDPSGAKEAKSKGGKAGRVVKNKWQVISGEHHVGEELVTQKVNKMAKTGELTAGTRLIHPKLGVRFVSNGNLIEKPEIHPAEVRLD